MSDADVTLRLTHEEALVLFEYLARTSKTDTLAFADKAEEIVLWNIEAQLEHVLVEPFQKNYDVLLASARQVVRGARA